MRLPLWTAQQKREREWEQRYSRQLQAVRAGAESEPPWIAFPENAPWWGGWRQGYGEVWLQNVFLPFWKRLGPGEREEYLERWPPPDEDWREYLTEIWI